MTSPRTLRWRERRTTWRPEAEDFDRRKFGVEIIGKGEALDFVTRHHYSRSLPPTSIRVGLFRSRTFFAPELVGVATLGGGASQAIVPHWCPNLVAADGMFLSRFVLLDEVEYNAETFFLKRVFKALRATRPAVRVVISYSDPVPRRDEGGVLTMPGHIGRIYQIKGASYRDRTEPEKKWLDERGCLLDGRSLSKVRALDRDNPAKSKGGESYARHLVALGAPPRRIGEAFTAWLERVTEGGEGPFRAMRHPGNHVYLFSPRGTSDGLFGIAPHGPLPRVPTMPDELEEAA